MRFISLAFFLTLSVNAPARADMLGWAILPENPVTGTVGTAVCPYEDPAGGNHNCLSLECQPGEPLTLAVSLAGFDAPDSVTLGLSIEGEDLWDLRLLRQSDGRYAKGMSGAQWADGLAALQAGAWGAVTFSTEAYLWHDHLPLNGSRDGIAAALDACWTARTDPALNPAQAAREDVRAWCADRLNRPATINDGFTREEDIDGDGRRDVIANYGAVNCGPIGGAWCGWAGCDLALHLARDDGYLQAFRGIAEGFRVVEDGVVIRRHISECGPDHAGVCAVRYRATDEGLVKAGTAEWPSDRD
ncbi:hypothetical protein [Maritimibacter dapengensis]|uniref:Uncharacterized protein n=1 Tax=Maritimibacter dapengensis TaxID=2836868 RepID=A0ABS6T067_9RHOB|nr:hypothetical protein [Maritimibacter dapengensis]MBV7378153.1 hypothetical protein [Maritimibacter dapengensis]